MEERPEVYLGRVPKQSLALAVMDQWAQPGWLVNPMGKVEMDLPEFPSLAETSPGGLHKGNQVRMATRKVLGKIR